MISQKILQLRLSEMVATSYHLFFVAKKYLIKCFLGAKKAPVNEIERSTPMNEGNTTLNSEPALEPVNTVEQTPQSDDNAEKGLTQAEVDKLITEAKEQAANEALEEYKKEQEKQANLEGMSEKERLAKQLEDLEKENKRLVAEAKRNQMITQARSEFSKDGLSVPDNILEVIVTTDEQQTLSNMGNLKAFADSLRNEWELEYSKGVTPKVATNEVDSQTSAVADVLKEYKNKRVQGVIY